MTVMRSDDSLPPGLRRAVDALREEPEVRQEWMDGVVRAAATQRLEDVASPELRRWTFRPSVAIAAGLMFAALGSGITYTVMRPAPATSPTLVAIDAADRD